MTELLEMKQRLKIFYGKYDVYLKPALKFLLALFAFFMINEQIGFMQKLSGPAVSLLLALLCSFLPVNMIAVFAGLLVCAHAYALSLEVFAMATGLLAVMYILYFRVSPKYGYVLVLTPIAFLLKIPYAVPLTMGLLGGPACVVPVACGTVFYYLIYYMKNNEAMLASSETEQMTSRLSYLVENVLNNKTVILTVLVFAVVLMIVYAIPSPERRSCMAYCDRSRSGDEYSPVPGRSTCDAGESADHSADPWYAGVHRDRHGCGVLRIQRGLFQNRVCAV